MGRREGEDHSSEQPNDAPPRDADGSDASEGESQEPSRLERVLRSAQDVSSPAWPPRWLQVLALGYLTATLLKISNDLLEIVTSTTMWIFGTAWGSIVAEPIRTYFDKASGDLAVSSQALWGFWLFSGIGLLLMSFVGATGARIGWAIHGALTVGVIWQDDGPSAPTAIGVYALSWSLLAVLAFRRMAYRSPYRPSPRHWFARQSRTRLFRLLLGPELSEEIGARASMAQLPTHSDGGRSAEARGAEMQRQVDRLVLESGYTDFIEFVKANWGRRRKGLAEDLRIPTWFFTELLYVHFPPKKGEKMGITPWQIREEAVSFHRKGESFAAIARRYRIAASTVSQWVRDYQEKRPEATDASASNDEEQGPGSTENQPPIT